MVGEGEPSQQLGEAVPFLSPDNKLPKSKLTLKCQKDIYWT
jgi:hypothetical protein